MAIPVHLQQFKAAGVYRVVFDKSTIMGVDSEILRLVVGYSEVGPFNIPTYVKSASEFKAIYGDISKKLERRGVFFHRTALHALLGGPILCLNLKKFAGETVGGATINTDFNPTYNIIDTVKINVEDIYDTSRFWELSAEKLINLKAVDNAVMDQYINIVTTNTKNTSASFFIRKPSGTKLNQYNITVSDWYSDKVDEMPDFLKEYKYNKISDFFVELYVFGGHFTADQVLASSTLKKYFEIATNKDGEVVNEDKETRAEVDDPDNFKPGIMLRPYILNAYGEPSDTLDALYVESTASPIAHYIGCLIPNFKNKKGQYQSLDILFNSDQDVHNMMMSFNTDALDEELMNIDMSGRFGIATSGDGLTLDKIYNGNATSSLLGNDNATVVSDVPTVLNNVVKINDEGEYEAMYELTQSNTKISGTLYVSNYNATSKKITLKQVGSGQEVTVTGFADEDSFNKALYDLHCASRSFDGEKYVYEPYEENGTGTYYTGNAYIKTTETTVGEGDEATTETVTEFFHEGPKEIITSITRIAKTSDSSNADAIIYSDSDLNMYPSFMTVNTAIVSNMSSAENIYGSSIDFIDSTGWHVIDAVTDKLDTTNGTIKGQYCIVADTKYESSLASILSVGDCLLAEDASADRDEDGTPDIPDSFYDNAYVQSIELMDVIENAGSSSETVVSKYVIKLTAKPVMFKPDAASPTYIVKVTASINQEIGHMMPVYLEGYTYLNSKPEGTDMMSKLNWQKFILSALTEYKGLRTGLLDKSNIDYRYIIDTFESYVDNGLKNVLSYLAKQKQSAFAILNFPSVKTFVKCPYSAYTDSKGVFNVDYIVKGFNNKKPSGVKFTLPEDADGASFCAFYTPLKFSDGYIDSIYPSAGLVSNLFMEKYTSRQPYYIIAGPNYGAIRANGLVGPDYKYSQDELQLIEPFGVNCMIYRPGFGTFINANQTAKQTPVSALSKVNIRELVIYLQDEIEKVLQAYQWEFNNPRTRAAIKERADQICARVAANGGIQKYINVMDESNNTPEIIDNEMAVLSTHIEPGFGCGKMVQELTLYRTGQMSSMISD